MKNFVGNLLLTLVGLLVGLVGFEVIGGYLELKPPLYRISVDGFFGKGDYRLHPNKKIIYVPKSGSGNYNKWGYRGTEYPLKKSKKRLLFLGDSVLDATGMPESLRMTHLVDEHLQDIEVLNFAVAGYSIEQTIAYAKEIVPQFDPDYLVIGLCGNDQMMSSEVTQRFSHKLDIMAYHKSPSLNLQVWVHKVFGETLFMKWALYYWLLYKPFSPLPIMDQMRIMLPDNQVKQLLQELKGLSQEHSFDVLFLGLPNRSDWLNRELTNLIRLIERSGADVFDMRPRFSKTISPYHIDEFFFKNDWVHFNPRGQKVLTNIFLDFWNERELLTERNSAN